MNIFIEINFWDCGILIEKINPSFNDLQSKFCWDECGLGPLQWKDAYNYIFPLIDRDKFIFTIMKYDLNYKYVFR